MNFPQNASKPKKDIVEQYLAHFLERIKKKKNLSLFNILIKNSCLNKSNFSSEFALFKHGKKNKFSEYFSALM